MKRSTESATAGQLRPAFIAGLACVVLTAATLAQAGTVQPPPLPPGSAMVRIEPGMNKEESKREDRAHHHKGQNKKDINKDDSGSGNNGNGKNDDKGSKK
jgi:hypothetical protein